MTGFSLTRSPLSRAPKLPRFDSGGVPFSESLVGTTGVVDCEVFSG